MKNSFSLDNRSIIRETIGLAEAFKLIGSRLKSAAFTLLNFPDYRPMTEGNFYNGAWGDEKKRRALWKGHARKDRRFLGSPCSHNKRQIEKYSAFSAFLPHFENPRSMATASKMAAIINPTNTVSLTNVALCNKSQLRINFS